MHRLETIIDHKGLISEISLVTLSSFDRETEAAYSMTLTANDLVNPVATQNIRVRIRDVNDNRPKFSQRRYQAEVGERAAPGEHVIHAQATDADSGEFGNIRYTLYWDDVIGTPPSSPLEEPPFSVNVTSGEVTVSGTLDRETRSEYRLTLEASDLSSATRAKFYIRLLDYNDNPPAISISYDIGSGTAGHMSPPKARVSENSPPATFVIHLEVTDADVGDNGKVTCRLTSGRERFSLVELYAGQYKLMTSTGDLDRELVPTYEVGVKCSDAGSMSLTSSVVVEVELVDVNDNSPIFRQSEIHVSVMENSKEGLYIYIII